MTNITFNGIFKDPNGKRLGYARVERTENGFKFPIVKVTGLNAYSNLNNSFLELYNRRTDELVETIKLDKYDMFGVLQSGHFSLRYKV